MSYKQLQGEALSYRELEDDCYPLVGLADQSKVYYPCGIKADSMFTDTFSPFDLDNGSEFIRFLEEKTTWPSELQKFKETSYDVSKIAPPPSWHSFLGFSDYTTKESIYKIYSSPRFLNWIKAAPHPNFRKLLMRHEGNLKKGEYVVHIKNSNFSLKKDFDVKTFGGTKSFILGTTGIFGASNRNLAIIAIISGCIFLLNGFFVLFHLIRKPRELGDRSFIDHKRENISAVYSAIRPLLPVATGEKKKQDHQPNIEPLIPAEHKENVKEEDIQKADLEMRSVAPS